MITKTGTEYVALLEKTADSAIGAIIGAVRASNLSDEERKKLIAYYALPQDASLSWRNAGRGALGGGIGAAVGANLPLSLPLRLGATLGGGALGIKYMTDKYSKSSPALL